MWMTIVWVTNSQREGRRGNHTKSKSRVVAHVGNRCHAKHNLQKIQNNQEWTIDDDDDADGDEDETEDEVWTFAGGG